MNSAGKQNPKRNGTNKYRAYTFLKEGNRIKLDNGTIADDNAIIKINKLKLFIDMRFKVIYSCLLK